MAEQDDYKGRFNESEAKRELAEKKTKRLNDENERLREENKSLKRLSHSAAPVRATDDAPENAQHGSVKHETNKAKADKKKPTKLRSGLPWSNKREKKEWEFLERAFGLLTEPLHFQSLEESVNAIRTQTEELTKEFRLFHSTQRERDKETTTRLLAEREQEMRNLEEDLRRTQGELNAESKSRKQAETALQEVKRALQEAEDALRKLEDFNRCVEIYQEIQEYVETNPDAALRLLPRNDPFAFIIWCGDKQHMQTLHNKLVESPRINDEAYRELAWKVLDFCILMTGKVTRTHYARMCAKPGDPYNRTKHRKKGTEIPSATSKIQSVIFDGIMENDGQRTLCQAYVECTT